MTLAAPRSRQGRLLLVLAFLAATVASLGIFFWANSAQAATPAGTTVTITDNGTGGLAVGSTITYTVVIDTEPGPGQPPSTTNAHFEFDPDPNLWPISMTSDAAGPWQTGECVVGAFFFNTVACNDAAGPLDDDTIVITMVVMPAIDYFLDPPTFCGLWDDNVGNDGGAGCTFVGLADQSISDWVSTPETDANGPGQDHTVSFYLPPGFTCESDVLLNDGTRTCDTVLFTDVTVTNCATATVLSVTVDDANLNSDANVDVTINSPAACSATISLAVKYDTQGNTQTPEIDVQDPEATKTYGVTAPGADPGELRHRDEPDLGTEDAAGAGDSDPLDAYCVNVIAPDQCGILAPQDDLDDAIGSFHEACIVGTLLTQTANGADITWNIQNVSGNVTINPFPAGQKIAGPNDIPCVRWASGGTGTQNITATYDNGLDPATDFFWDATVPLPLIKEWNDIDETHIVAATGDVGDTIAQNSGELDDWGNRDCAFVPVDAGFCTRPNLDGLTLDQSAAFIINSPLGILISAPGRSFIDYTFGDHSDVGGAYSGPVDGAQQTYTISGDCGSVRLEDPSTGYTVILSNDLGAGNYTPSYATPWVLPNPPVNPYASATILTSDKGTGFEFLPNNDGSLVTDLGNADCGPNAVICITITTEEDNLFHSPPIDTADEEEICIRYVVGPPTSKTPILAWAGQRVVLEHYWGDGTQPCPELDFPNGDPAEFGVLYTKQAGPGAFTAALQGNPNDVDLTSSDVIVDVDVDIADENNDGITDPNSNCTSRIVYESEDQGEVDISAFVVDDNDNLNNADPRSQQVAFVIYFLKFESLTLEIIPDESGGHSAPSQDSSAVNPPTGASSFESNVSANVLARSAVRGWVLTDNCPARDSRVGSNGEFIPANRCIFPDDWAFKAGGSVVGPETRPNFDIYGGSTSGCTRVTGPFSLLDILPDGTAGGCNDSLAPHTPADGGASAGCFTGGLTYDCRQVMFPNGVIDADDAPMPPALLRFLLSGSGFLFGADKANYFTATHIPAEPWLAPINNDLSGYQWNSWGGAGGKDGPYDFWTDYADTGPETVSCARNSTGANVTQADPCPNEPGVGVPTGGYNLTKVYTDEHGVAYTWVNGDANLSFDECATSAANAGHNIVLLSGFYCEDGDLVGSSTLNALVDYPDKRKHFAIDSDDVTITWTWGGIKDVTVEPGASAQFNYVVLHVTDRDGFCGGSPSFWPVLGEQVNFTIDSPTGLIVPDVNGNPAAALGSVAADGKSAVTFTFDTNANASIANGGITVTPVIVNGECQAWIHVSESLLAPVNVLITAFDPEGTVTFDVIINPTPTPSPVPPTPTPEPTPTPSQIVIWGDWDCDGEVNIGDAVAVARTIVNLDFDQESPCPTMEDTYQVTQNSLTHPRIWGDADCSGTIDIGDAIKIARSLVNLPIVTFADCPGLGQQVHIPA